MRRKTRLGVTLSLVAAMVLMLAAPAFATIHPVVESFDCAADPAFENHPLGDPADPPGATPGATPGNGNNVLRAIIVLTDGFTDLSSPAVFGHKLDGECGRVGQLP